MTEYMSNMLYLIVLIYALSMCFPTLGAAKTVLMLMVVVMAMVG